MAQSFDELDFFLPEPEATTQDGGGFGDMDFSIPESKEPAPAQEAGFGDMDFSLPEKPQIDQTAPFGLDADDPYADSPLHRPLSRETLPPVTDVTSQPVSAGGDDLQADYNRDGTISDAEAKASVEPLQLAPKPTFLGSASDVITENIYLGQQALGLTTQLIDFLPSMHRGFNANTKKVLTKVLGKEKTDAFLDILPTKNINKFLDASGKLREESRQWLMESAREKGGRTGQTTVELVEMVEDTLMNLRMFKMIGAAYGAGATGSATAGRIATAMTPAKFAKHADKTQKVLNVLGGAFKRSGLRTAVTEQESLQGAAKQMAISMAYQSTPAVSGWFSNNAAVVAADIALNLGISATQTQQTMADAEAMAVAEGRPEDAGFYKFLGLAKLYGTDVVFGAMTRTLREAKGTQARKALQAIEKAKVVSEKVVAESEVAKIEERIGDTADAVKIVGEPTPVAKVEAVPEKAVEVKPEIAKVPEVTKLAEAESAKIQERIGEEAKGEVPVKIVEPAKVKKAEGIEAFKKEGVLDKEAVKANRAEIKAPFEEAGKVAQTPKEYKQIAKDYIKEMMPEAVKSQKESWVNSVRTESQLKSMMKKVDSAFDKDVPTVKQQIREGVRPADEKIVTTDSRLNKIALMAQKRGIREARPFIRAEAKAQLRAALKDRAARKAENMKANRDTILEYAKQFLVPPASLLKDTSSLSVKEMNKLAQTASDPKLPLAMEQIRKIAASAKTPQSLANALKKVDVEIAKAENRASRKLLLDEIGKAKKEKLDPTQQKVLDEFLGDFRKAELSDKKTLSLQATERYIKANPDHNVPAALVDRIAELSKVPISDMTTDDLRSVSAYMGALRKAGKLKRSAKIKQKNRPIWQHSADFVKESQARTNDQKEMRPGVVAPKERGLLGKLFLQSANLETLAHKVDGGRYDKLYEIMFGGEGGIKEGVERVERAQADFENYVKTELSKAGISDKELLSWSQDYINQGSKRFGIAEIATGGRKDLAQKVAKKAKSITVTLPSSGKAGRRTAEKLTLTYDELARLWRYGKNSKTLANLLDGEKGGIRLDASPTKAYRLTQQDLDRIYSKIPSKVKRFGDIMHKYENTIQKTEMNKVSNERINTDVAIESDYVRSSRWHGDLPSKLVEARKAMSPHEQGLDDRSFTKAKTGIRAPLLLKGEMVDMWSSTAKVNQYIGLAESIGRARAFMSQKNVRAEIERAHGKDMLTRFDKAINEIENPPKLPDNVINQTLEKARRNTVKALLGVGGTLGRVAGKQPASYWLASTEIDKKYLAKGLVTKLPSKERVARGSAILGRRIGSGRFERDVGPANSGMEFFTGKKSLSDKLMAPTSFTDALTIRKLWNAAELEIKAKNPSLKGEALERAIGKRTEEIARRTQPTFGIEDRSEISRQQNFLLNTVTSFTSQLNKNQHMIVRSVNKYKGSAKTVKDKAELAESMTMIMLIVPMQIAIIDEATDALMVHTGAKKEKKNPLPIAGRLALRTLKSNMNTVYALGPAFSAIVDRASGNTFMGGTGLPNIVDSQIKNTELGAGAIAEDALTGEWEDSTLKAADQLVMSLNNMITGLPVGPARRSASTLLRLAGAIDKPETKSKKKKATRRSPRKKTSKGRRR